MEPAACADARSARPRARQPAPASLHSLNPFDLSGRTAVVTGANTGLGQGIALALAGAGASIVALGDGRDAGVEVAGTRFHANRADLSTTEPLKGIVEKSARAFGGLGILVNNASIIRPADALDVTQEDWDAVIDTNLNSAFFLSQTAGRHMLERSHWS